MNFSTFGNNFPTTIPNFHQIAAKFSQENLAVPSASFPNNARLSAQPTHSVQELPVSATTKYPPNYMNQHIYEQNGTRVDRRVNFQEQVAQEICAVILQQEDKNSTSKIKQDSFQDCRLQHQSQTSSSVPSTWPTLNTPSSSVVDYLSHLPASLSLHHFLKFSAENLKKDTSTQDSNLNQMTQAQSSTINMNHLNNQTNTSFNSVSSFNTTPQPVSSVRKKKKKKIEKEKKPRPKPGEIRLTTALDGSTLYCCPECHMAYPERELLEQHLLGHTLERKFFCDVCGAGLKRKDHLTRHKQSHNPERPFICSVCLKAFKRKEQLTLHFVIHSGEKRHICPECGKGFYRKDHLRKHTRSHIARRVKAELSQQVGSIPQNSTITSSS